MGTQEMAAFELAPNVWIGENQPAFVIAEAGNNHNGSMYLAKELIKQAHECGADCVKFQKRTIEKCLSKALLDKPYTGNNSYGATYREHREYLELSKEQFIELKKYADELGIMIAASAWDEDAVDLLMELKFPFIKIASADLTNLPLLEYAAQKGVPLLLSTGMANMEEVKRAYDLVSEYNDRIVLMQCTSTYPLDSKDVNLNVIHTYKREFPNAVIGYSGHERGIQISLAAATLGAAVIERHFTLDRTSRGSDHAASLESEGLRRLVRDIRVVEEAMGSADKRVQESERPCITKLRKSLVYTHSIAAGTKLQRSDLCAKSPGNGISPAVLQSFVGKRLKKAVKDDELVEWDDIGEKAAAK